MSKYIAMAVVGGTPQSVGSAPKQRAQGSAETTVNKHVCTDCHDYTTDSEGGNCARCAWLDSGAAKGFRCVAGSTWSPGTTHRVYVYTRTTVRHDRVAKTTETTREDKVFSLEIAPNVLAGHLENWRARHAA